MRAAPAAIRAGPNQTGAASHIAAIQVRAAGRTHASTRAVPGGCMARPGHTAAAGGADWRSSARAWAALARAISGRGLKVSIQRLTVAGMGIGDGNGARAPGGLRPSPMAVPEPFATMSFSLT
jgi:hypothetical protein